MPPAEWIALLDVVAKVASNTRFVSDPQAGRACLRRLLDGCAVAESIGYRGRSCVDRLGACTSGSTTARRTSRRHRKERPGSSWPRCPSATASSAWRATASAW